MMLGSLSESVRTWLAVVPKPAKLAAAAFVVLLVALAGFRLLSGGGEATAKPSATSTGAAPAEGEGAVMLRRQGSALVGVLRSTDGAAAAALSYMQQRNALLSGGTTSQEAADVGSQIALGGHDIGENPASIPDRVATTSPESMLLTRAGQMTWWTIPLGYAVRSYRESSATVRVFSALLSVQADPAAGPGAIAFSLVDVRLAWRDGGWRIGAVDETRDQPAPALAVAVNSRRDSADLPIRERIIASREATGTPLFRFLTGAVPFVHGPQGMGPVDGVAPADEDARAIMRDASVGSTDLARSAGILTGGTGRSWRTLVPVAYRPVPCPGGARGVRCYYALVVGTGTERDEVASVQMALAGYAIDGTGQDLRVQALEVPVDDQRDVLGGQVTVAQTVDDERRTTLAAWQRSIVPLRPALPAVPR